MRIRDMALAVAWGLAVGAAGCGGAAGRADTVVAADAVDVPDPSGTDGGDAGQTGADGASDRLGDAGVGDPDGVDPGPPDPGLAYAGDDDGGATGDPGPAADPGADPGPGPAPCARATACGPRATCNLSTGQCEARAAGWSPFALLSAVPAEGAPGDFLVIDGAGFGLFTGVQVGGASLQKDGDENRIVAVRGAGTNGTLKVGNATWDTPIATSEALADVQACRPTDPPATGVVPVDPAEIGPWAVGFADRTGGLFGAQVRVYYPATCGGLRRPPADGKFPFVAFVHGDGYVALNFEYLARHLASWGFLAAIPGNVDYAVVKTGRTAPGDWFAPLAGHQAGGDAAIVCHSKGAEYTHDLGLANIGAVVFLGPVYTIEDPYGSLFPIQGLVLGGSEDGAPTADRCRDVYDQLRSPRYMVMVKRGTHGQFLDDKMWEPPSDGSGDYVARNRQHEIVQAFTLAYLQRVFGMPEAFPGLLSDPGLADEIAFWADP